MIEEMIQRMLNVLSDWHEEDLRQFILPLDCATPEVLLAHCNYCTWHMISDELNPIGERMQNVKRNYLISLLDDEFFRVQKGTGLYNSETLGSILDRLTVTQLKVMHSMADAHLSLKEERDRLEVCAIQLYHGMLRGERQCFRTHRTKIDYEGRSK